MTGIAKPPPLFNPITAPAGELLTFWEILAGPFGLIAFLPLIPLLRLIARRDKRAALLGGGFVWMLATVGPWATLIVPAACAAAGGWLLGLARLTATKRLSPRIMIALVWIGLSAMIFPLWWYPQWAWYGWGGPSRMAVLHNLGFAYFYLRLIAWGYDLVRRPQQPLRPWETLCWLMYPPCMRLGPVLLRARFLERYDAWQPEARPPWGEIGRRLGWFLLGGALLAVVMKNMPRAMADGDFFATPELYTTGKLVRAFYLAPIQVYLLLWIYNELAAALSYWVGVRVDNNFDWLPTSASVRDFWRRWHVTVGAWMRDYIYIPLGGNRGNSMLNYSAVFGFCALWHGASWSFAAWAASQVIALEVQRLWDRLVARAGWSDTLRGKWWTFLCWLLTLHYQIATIVVFVDFEHLGLRLFREIWRRLSGLS